MKQKQRSWAMIGAGCVIVSLVLGAIYRDFWHFVNMDLDGWLRRAGAFLIHVLVCTCFFLISRMSWQCLKAIRDNLGKDKDKRTLILDLGHTMLAAVMSVILLVSTLCGIVCGIMLINLGCM